MKPPCQVEGRDVLRLWNRRDVLRLLDGGRRARARVREGETADQQVGEQHRVGGVFLIVDDERGCCRVSAGCKKALQAAGTCLWHPCTDGSS